MLFLSYKPTNQNKGFLNGLFCCYSNLLCHKDGHYLFINVNFFDTIIVASTKIQGLTLIHQRRNSENAANCYELTKYDTKQNMALWDPSHYREKYSQKENYFITSHVARTLRM